jgi:hypothetical protein
MRRWCGCRLRLGCSHSAAFQIPSDGLRWIPTNRISARVVAVFADIVADDFIECHRRSLGRSRARISLSWNVGIPFSRFFQKYST